MVFRPLEEMFAALRYAKHHDYPEDWHPLTPEQVRYVRFAALAKALHNAAPERERACQANIEFAKTNAFGHIDHVFHWGVEAPPEDWSETAVALLASDDPRIIVGTLKALGLLRGYVFVTSLNKPLDDATGELVCPPELVEEVGALLGHPDSRVAGGALEYILAARNPAFIKAVAENVRVWRMAKPGDTPEGTNPEQLAIRALDVLNSIGGRLEFAEQAVEAMSAGQLGGSGDSAFTQLVGSLAEWSSSFHPWHPSESGRPVGYTPPTPEEQNAFFKAAAEPWRVWVAAHREDIAAGKRWPIEEFDRVPGLLPPWGRMGVVRNGENLIWCPAQFPEPPHIGSETTH